MIIILLVWIASKLQHLHERSDLHIQTMFRDECPLCGVCQGPDETPDNSHAHIYTISICSCHKSGRVASLFQNLFRYFWTETTSFVLFYFSKLNPIYGLFPIFEKHTWLKMVDKLIDEIADI